MGRGTNVIFEFQTIIDLDLAIIKLVQIKYNNTKYMHKDIAKGSEYFIKCILLLRENINPLSVIINDDYIHTIDKTLVAIMENDLGKILKLATPTDMFGLMQTYNKTDGAINCTVLCKNIQQELYIKSINKDIKTIVCESNFDLTEYDSIFLKDYNDILSYQNVNGKSIFLMNYPFNLEKDSVTPLIPVSIQIADVNKVYLTDIYVGFKFPEKIVTQ